MLLVDSNVWLALTTTKHKHHAAADRWFVHLTPSEKAIFCRSTQQSYLRLLTTAAVFAQFGLAPLTNQEAWTAYELHRADS